MPGFYFQTDSRLQQIKRVDREPLLLAFSRKWQQQFLPLENQGAQNGLITVVVKVLGSGFFLNLWILFNFKHLQYTKETRFYFTENNMYVYITFFTNKSFFSSLRIYFCCQSLAWLRTAALSCRSLKCLL